MKHDSNDVKQIVGQIVIWLAQSFPNMLPSNLIRQLIPLLVNGTKERNTLVRANSELALVALLHLRVGETGFQVRTGVGGGLFRATQHTILQIYTGTRLIGTDASFCTSGEHSTDGPCISCTQF